MKLYLLEQVNSSNVESHVVLANDAGSARALVADRTGNKEWLSPLTARYQKIELVPGSRISTVMTYNGHQRTEEVVVPEGNNVVLGIGASPLPKRKPLCPLDVPDEVWEAVAKEYKKENWSPAPNYHVEYRDCRNAWLATEALRHVEYREVTGDL